MGWGYTRYDEVWNGFSLPQNGGNLDQLGISTLKRKLNFQVQARRQVVTFRRVAAIAVVFYNQDLDRIMVASGINLNHVKMDTESFHMNKWI